MRSAAGLNLQTRDMQVLTSSRHKALSACRTPHQTCVSSRKHWMSCLLTLVTHAQQQSVHTHTARAQSAFRRDRCLAWRGKPGLHPACTAETCACTHGQQTRTATKWRRGDSPNSGAHPRPPPAPRMCNAWNSKSARETHSSTYAGGTGSGAHAPLVSPAHVRLEPVARSFLSRGHVLDFRVPAACRRAATLS